MRAEAAVALALALAACSESAPGGATSSGAPAEAPPALPPSAVESEISTRPVELLSWQFTSGVAAKNPVDTITSAKPGQRVYLHLTVRNRTGKKQSLSVTFHVNGHKRTEVDLSVDESWSWRTWAYNTILETDEPGKLDVEVVDEEGHPILDASLPVVR